jgi:hypothetical protein
VYFNSRESSFDRNVSLLILRSKTFFAKQSPFGFGDNFAESARSNIPQTEMRPRSGNCEVGKSSSAFTFISVDRLLDAFGNIGDSLLGAGKAIREAPA